MSTRPMAKRSWPTTCRAPAGKTASGSRCLRIKPSEAFASTVSERGLPRRPRCQTDDTSEQLLIETGEHQGTHGEQDHSTDHVDTTNDAPQKPGHPTKGTSGSEKRDGQTGGIGHQELTGRAGIRRTYSKRQNGPKHGTYTGRPAGRKADSDQKRGRNSAAPAPRPGDVHLMVPAQKRHVQESDQLQAQHHHEDAAEADDQIAVGEEDAAQGPKRHAEEDEDGAEADHEGQRVDEESPPIRLPSGATDPRQVRQIERDERQDAGRGDRQGAGEKCRDKSDRHPSWSRRSREWPPRVRRTAPH